MIRNILRQLKPRFRLIVIMFLLWLDLIHTKPTNRLPKTPKTKNAPSPDPFVDVNNISDILSSIKPLSLNSPVYAALQRNRSGCGTIFTVTNIINRKSQSAYVNRVQTFIRESIAAARAFKLSRVAVLGDGFSGSMTNDMEVGRSPKALPSICGGQLKIALMLHQETLDFFRDVQHDSESARIFRQASTVFDIIDGIFHDNTTELDSEGGVPFETIMEKDIPWFNKRFGGPNMGMRQILAWAMSPFLFTVVADGDVKPCPNGLIGLLNRLHVVKGQAFDLIYGPPMFGMARSGNYRMGYRILPEIRAVYDTIRSPQSNVDKATAMHLSKPSQLAALNPTKPRYRQVVVACAPYEPGAAIGGKGATGGILNAEMPFECFREPNTGVMAFAMDRSSVRLLLLKAYDAYRRLIVGARSKPRYFIGGSGTQYAFREAIWAMVHGSRYLQMHGQHTSAAASSDSDPVGQLPVAPFRVAMFSSICRAMSCRKLLCGERCLIIHSRKECGRRLLL